MSLLTRVTGSVLFLTNNCYCTLNLNSAKVKVFKRHISKVSERNERWCGARFMYSESSKPPENKKSYVEFDKLVKQRRKQAERSIIVQIKSYEQWPEVYRYCKQFGEINKVYHYTIPSKVYKNFILIEFMETQNLNSALSFAKHENLNKIPVQSPLLQFHNIASQNKEVNNVNIEKIKVTQDSCKAVSYTKVLKKLIMAESVSEQIEIMYKCTKLNDAGIRIRFYTACQIEKCYQSLLPNVAVLPFGSSVNSFGTQNCDLDLNLVLDTNEMTKSSSKLVFHNKPFHYTDRRQKRRIMETLAETIDIFLPGISNVKKILHATVPIIKFDHLLCGIQCDLAMSNQMSYYMSELLYMYGEIDSRVRPLTLFIRQWAETSLLVSKDVPGPWIKNFSLTLMVIFFLQQKQILPDIATLKSKASKNDIRVVNNIDCTFLRDISKVPKTQNNDSLETLLLDFFKYYSNFDFSTEALSLETGKPIPKPDESSLYICNPMETNMNVSKNVNQVQLDLIVVAMRSAVDCMERLESKKPDNQNWGLLGLLLNNSWMKYDNRKSKLDFQTLFEKEEEEEEEKEMLSQS